MGLANLDIPTCSFEIIENHLVEVFWGYLTRRDQFIESKNSGMESRSANPLMMLFPRHWSIAHRDIIVGVTTDWGVVMITVGTLCSIMHDIIVEGQVAFRAGETVVVEQITPNPQRPEYKYVVTSSSLQKAFQLSDGDLVPSAPSYEAPPPLAQGPYQQSAPPPSGYEPGQQPFAAYGAGVPPVQYPVQTEKKWTSGMLIAVTVIGVLGLVCVLVPLIIYIPVSLNTRSNAQTRTCQSNLRTVDGAIQSYESMMPNDEAPTSLDDLTQPGTNVLRRIPTCPSGNRPYIWVTGTPPEISCPNNASHTI